ncbi:ATP-binding protein [Geoglobus acetivorans]|uniref:Bipolar DNA helicase n=1 Tax=Geoglobus acetivorans TaxID=565033 RepID=A0A0A7GI75_GEOAI|nr:bipolar DNA helicase [Geoglobus acetivorans]
MKVGIVKGPAENPYEFRFITPDSKALKVGEFVYYVHEGKKVLCRVMKRLPLRHYPDIYLSNPDVEPGRILKVLGLSSREYDLFEMRAVILGYYSRELGFVNPRIPPKPGQAVFLAEKDVIEEALLRKRKGELGSIHAGFLLNRDEDIPIVLDTSLTVSEHLAILAGTGSGKSYLAGVIVEELLKPYNRASVLVFDPHGEYHTLKEVEGLDEFSEGGYRPSVRIYGREDIKLRVSELDYDEIVNLLPNLTEKMEATLNRIYRDLSERENFTSGDIIARIEEMKNNEELAESTASGLIWRIRRYLLEMEIIDDYRHMSLKDLLKPGQASILQLTEMNDLEQEILVSALMKRILKARINAEKGLDGEKLDYPVFVIVEEAHRFASKDSRSYDVLRTILSEGRKFGVGVCLISQRPSKIDSDILSQCMTQIIMRIVNPADQENIRKSVESIGREMIEELPGLTKGQAIVAGVAVNTPVLMRARKRHTSHGGASKNAPEEWIRWSEKGESKGIFVDGRARLFWDED